MFVALKTQIHEANRVRRRSKIPVEIKPLDDFILYNVRVYMLLIAKATVFCYSYLILVWLSTFFLSCFPILHFAFFFFSR